LSYERIAPVTYYDVVTNKLSLHSHFSYCLTKCPSFSFSNYLIAFINNTIRLHNFELLLLKLSVNIVTIVVNQWHFVIFFRSPMFSLQSQY